MKVRFVNQRGEPELKNGPLVSPGPEVEKRPVRLPAEGDIFQTFAFEVFDGQFDDRVGVRGDTGKVDAFKPCAGDVHDRDTVATQLRTQGGGVNHGDEDRRAHV